MNGGIKSLKQLRIYVREQCRLTDKSSHEWEAGGAKRKRRANGFKVQAAYWAGAWFAYRDMQNRLGQFPTSKEMISEASKRHAIQTLER